MKEIITDKLCSHCNVNVARYISRGGLLCCESNTSKCPKIRSAIGKNTGSALSRIDENTGLSNSKMLALKIKENAMNNGDKDPFVIAALKMVEVRKLNNSYMTGTKKSLITKSKINSDGLTINQISTSKMIKTRKKLGDDGLTNYQRSAIKAAETRINDVDEYNRNGYDRSWIKSGQAKEFPNTKIYYRSKLELKFLEKLTLDFGIEWVNRNVKNCKSFNYEFNGFPKKYIPDFEVDGKIYEIKSSYTFDNLGKNEELRKQNIKKMDSVLNLGMNIRFVLDGFEYDWAEYRLKYI